MRQSTPGNNLKTLIRDEIVTRFENVVLDEIKKYNAAIKDNSSRFTDLDQKIAFLLNLCNELKALIVQSKSHFVDVNLKQSEDTYTKFEEHRKYVYNKINNIESIVKDLCLSHENKATNESLHTEISLLNKKIEKMQVQFCESRKEMECIIDEVKRELKDFVLDLQANTIQRMSELQQEMKNYSENLTTYKIDAVGIMRELQIHKKSVFIAERKIEHLFTLMDRLKGVK